MSACRAADFFQPFFHERKHDALSLYVDSRRARQALGQQPTMITKKEDAAIRKRTP